MGKVADPDGAAADLVFIGRADTAPGGADLARPGGIFAEGIQVTVDGEDQGTGFGDHQHVRGDRQPLRGDFLNLGLERPWVEDHAVSDHRRRTADDSGGEQGQLVGFIADDERVAGVVAALETHDHVGAAGKPVHDLPFALVAPLRADDGDVAHANPLDANGRALGEGG